MIIYIYIYIIMHINHILKLKLIEYTIIIQKYSYKLLCLQCKAQSRLDRYSGPRGPKSKPPKPLKAGP